MKRAFPWLGIGVTALLLPACLTRHGVKSPESGPSVVEMTFPDRDTSEFRGQNQTSGKTLTTTSVSKDSNRKVFGGTIGLISGLRVGSGPLAPFDTPLTVPKTRVEIPPLEIPPLVVNAPPPPIPAPPTPEILPPTIIPAPPDPPLIAVIRAHCENRTEAAVQHMQHFEKMNQDLISSLIPVLAKLSETKIDEQDPDETAAMVEQLQSTADALRARASLRIGRACFCRWVSKFGLYEPLPKEYAFRAGETTELYLELRNASWEPIELPAQINAPGKLLTGAGCRARIATTLELMDADNRLVWRRDPPPRDDFSRIPRRDLYVPYWFTLPEGVPAGTYNLQIKLTDIPTGKSVKHSLDLRIAEGRR